MIKGSQTSVERRHLALIRLPKVLPLIQRPLRRTPLADIGVLGVRHCRNLINRLKSLYVEMFFAIIAGFKAGNDGSRSIEDSGAQSRSGRGLLRV